MKVSEYFEQKEKFEKMIEEFFKYLCKNELEIYNEFSFQHELGIFLRMKLKQDCEDAKEYRIEFERNAKTYFGVDYDFWENKQMKKEIDICVYKQDHSLQYAIELKFPLNKQYPEQMFKFIKDIKFMQELVNQKKFQRTYCITLVWSKGPGRPFYKGYHEGNRGIDIYKYFRGEKELITGKIMKPTGDNKYVDDLKEKEYPFEWKDCQIVNNSARDEKYKYRPCKYYIIECK